MAKLKFTNVNKVYPNNVQAVFDFNLDVDDKEFVVFVGPSGCGKSTTLRMIAGLEEISSGEIYIDNKLINEVPPVNRHIAMVFQNYALYPHLTVFDNMAFSLKLRKANFPVIDVDEENPDFIKRSEEIIEAIESETKAGIAKIKEDKNRKHRQNVKDRIKEYKFKQRNLLIVKIKELEKEFSKQRLTYDSELVEKLTNELKELLASEIKDEEAIKNKRAQIDEAYSQEVKPMTVYRHYNHEEIVDKVSKAAETLGLTPYLKRKPAALSGGQRQRVALGRAIVRNPRVFLMDEPLSNLDAKLRVQMRSEITKIHKSVGATTIYVTHDQTEAMTMATKIVCMKDGYIQQIGSPKDLFNSPENMFVASFIGSPATNLINGKFDGKAFIVEGTEFSVSLTKDQINLLKDYKDKNVVLGVRPEDIYLTGDPSVKNKSNEITLKCDISELLGRELIVYNPVGKDKIIAKINTRDDIVGGMLEKYIIDLDRIHFFDPETTKRIR